VTFFRMGLNQAFGHNDQGQDLSPFRKNIADDLSPFRSRVNPEVGEAIQHVPETSKNTVNEWSPNTLHTECCQLRAAFCSQRKPCS